MSAFSRPVWNANAWRLPSQRMAAILRGGLTQSKLKQQRRGFRTFLKVGVGVFSANCRGKGGSKKPGASVVDLHSPGQIESRAPVAMAVLSSHPRWDRGQC